MFKFFKNLFKKDNFEEQLQAMFVSLGDHMQPVQTEIEEIPNYFKPSEFACKDKCGDSKMDEHFLEMLNQARHIAGKPWKVNSGKRCAANNKAAGGVSSSSHLKGLAVDISATSGAKKFEVVKAAMEAGFTRIGIGKTFVHLDADQTKAQNTIWLY